MVQEEKKIVHTTKCRIDLEVLKQEIEIAHNQLQEIPTDQWRTTTQGRSAFVRWNNMNHFHEKLYFGNPVLEVTGTNTDGCARVYYNPSVTNVPKPARKAIVPVDEGNVFLFFDLKAAEYFMASWFAKNQTAIDAYSKGEDIYDSQSWMFPKGTTRAQYKTTLIADLYGTTAYAVGKRLGLTDTQSQRLLDAIATNNPLMGFHKIKVMGQAKRNGFYIYPHGFDITEFERVEYKVAHWTKTQLERNPALSETQGKRIFNPNLALSVYIQSALGWLMSSWIKLIEEKFQPNCLLTVFDSMLIEVSESWFDELRDFLVEVIAPFRASSFGKGWSFWEAAYGISDSGSEDSGSDDGVEEDIEE